MRRENFTYMTMMGLKPSIFHPTVSIDRQGFQRDLNNKPEIKSGRSILTNKTLLPPVIEYFGRLHLLTRNHWDFTVITSVSAFKAQILRKLGKCPYNQAQLYKMTFCIPHTQESYHYRIP